MIDVRKIVEVEHEDDLIIVRSDSDGLRLVEVSYLVDGKSYARFSITPALAKRLAPALVDVANHELREDAAARKAAATGR